MNGGWQETAVRRSGDTAAARGAYPVRYIGFTHPVFIEAAGWIPAVSESAAAERSTVPSRRSVHDPYAGRAADEINAVHERDSDAVGWPRDPLARAA